MNNIGSAIKKIRADKGLSQKYVSQGIMTQSNYSRFENGIIDVSASAFFEILVKLDIKFDEFINIYQNNSLLMRMNILNTYFELTYNNPEELKGILEKIKDYNPSEEDSQMIHLKLICESLLTLLKTKDINQAITGLNLVWQDLSRRNKLYITDIHILNSILFYFPVETIRNILNIIERNVKYYKKNQVLIRLELNTLINFSLLLIKNKNYIEAQSILEKSITLCKKHGEFLRLGICYVRKGIVISNLSDKNPECNYWINKGLLIIEELEFDGIVETLTIEINKYKQEIRTDS